MITLKTNTVDLYRQLLRIEHNLIIFKSMSISYYIKKRENASYDIKRIKERIKLISYYPIISH